MRMIGQMNGNRLTQNRANTIAPRWTHCRRLSHLQPTPFLLSVLPIPFHPCIRGFSSHPNFTFGLKSGIRPSSNSPST